MFPKSNYLIFICSQANPTTITTPMITNGINIDHIISFFKI